ncbi:MULTISPECIES: HAD family hydrolase [unclassified Streptomyces]|uniref:HAD family hydrolase n=1 Tax=unclassified Streptomyces TaxID=2593676 RepID=UPI000DC783BE|nr:MULTISPECIES: HAD family hydrolase [unclassified Streptomyces]AWZ04601.1 hypothetical protein DRB89_08050 [Streptomyces sp. ICC4]AWZ11419.1 hypothetical protein DRB96_02785 [Streptomyces sp. ICC1]
MLRAFFRLRGRLGRGFLSGYPGTRYEPGGGLGDREIGFGEMDRARAVVTAWSDLMPRVDQEVVALLKRARKAVTVALVSNATTRLDSDLARQGLDVLADAVVNTAHIGVAKPDPRVYLIAAEPVGAPVQRCLPRLPRLPRTFNPQPAEGKSDPGDFHGSDRSSVNPQVRGCVKERSGRASIAGGGLLAG